MDLNPRARQSDLPRTRRGVRLSGPLLLLALLAAVALTPLNARVEEQLTFPAPHLTVINADTVAYGSVRIRLKGIDAPDRRHSTHAAGRAFLKQLAGKAESIRCDLTGERTLGRRVGRCFAISSTGAETDLQSAVVSNGFARSCLRYGGWRYVKDENARSLRLPFRSYCIGFSIW